jgi:hypothetical protein
MSATEVDISVLLVCRDDDEQVGHAVRRVADHLRALALRSEILVVDEGSADNTLPLLSLLHRSIPELRVVAGADPGRGFVRGAELARGRSLLLLDARSSAPLSALGFALERLAAGNDAVAIGGRYLVLRRTRTMRAHSSLTHHRDAAELERRFLRRARHLGLAVDVAIAARRLTPWQRLRETLLAPLASRV